MESLINLLKLYKSVAKEKGLFSSKYYLVNNLESDFELFFGFKINLSLFKVQKFQARAFTLLAASFSQYFPSASILCISNVFGRVNLFDQNAFMECCIFFASLRG